MKPARSLRTRLALMYLMVFGLIQVLLGATILAVHEISIRQGFDSYLFDVAEDLADEVEELARARPADSQAPPAIRARRPRIGHWELRGPDGGMVTKSDSLGAASLPWSAAGSERQHAPSFRTARTGEAAAALGPLRIVRIYRDPEGVQPYYVQVGREMTTFERTIRNLHRLLLVVIPMGLLAAAAAANVVAKRSMEPLARMLREMRSITAADLSRRLPEPRIRDEIWELAQVVNGMLARLQTAFEAQDRFIADVSHELKTPLIALAAEAQTLSRPEASAAERRAFLAKVRDDGERLARTVESFLMLARAESGIPLARVEPVPLAEVLIDAVQSCTPEADQRGMRIRATLPLPPESGAEIQVRGDAALLRSLVENLVRNAVRHGPADSIVDLALRREGAEAVITILDQGPGIPPEHLERVFQRFARLTDASAGKGTGLGLAIARAIATLHGGGLTGRRPPSGGFELVVRLPIAT